MRCLLDKVTARHIMEGMLKLIEGRRVTSTELFALYFYQRASPGDITLFILPQTHNLLKRLEHLPRYVVLIRRFLAATQVCHPAILQTVDKTVTRIWFHKGRRGSTCTVNIWNDCKRRCFGHACSRYI